jgi:hypothetical protein
VILITQRSKVQILPPQFEEPRSYGRKRRHESRLFSRLCLFCACRRDGEGDLMTAVLRSFVSNWPIMLGDLLLSGPEQQNPVHVPTVADITEIFPTGSGWAPAALQQKIAMLADNLVVGWAGNRLAAKILIADLWEKSKAEPCTLASLKDYFRSPNLGPRC